jgi:hypothetical protein
VITGNAGAPARKALAGNYGLDSENAGEGARVPSKTLRCNGQAKPMPNLSLFSSFPILQLLWRRLQTTMFRR